MKTIIFGKINKVCKLLSYKRKIHDINSKCKHEKILPCAAPKSLVPGELDAIINPVQLFKIARIIYPQGVSCDSLTRGRLSESLSRS